MIRRPLLALLLTPALTLAAAAPALAASLPAANSGTISVYVPGTTAAATTGPAYEGLVAFSVTGTVKLRNPRVWVSCYQTGALVYAAGGSPTEDIKLGGDMSQWVMNGGGAANCSVELYYILNSKGTGEWNGNGPQGGIVDLAESAFNAAG